MTIRKRGEVYINENWSYDNNILEVVDNFNYLGTIFNYTGMFSFNQEYLACKALKALNILMYNCKKIHKLLKHNVSCLTLLLDLYLVTEVKFGDTLNQKKLNEFI